MNFFAIPFPPIDSSIIEFGPIVIRWYSLAYIVGILLGWFYARKLALLPEIASIAPSHKQIEDFIIWAVLGIILGGRLGYVLFYGLSDYIADPVSIIAFWNGGLRGMSFHGGALGVAIAVYLFTRRNKLHFWGFFDIIAACAPIGLFLGRLGNFANGELWGRVTTVPWAIIFPSPLAGGEPRHPSQIYEAVLEGLLLFFVLFGLIYVWKVLRYPGVVVGIFILGYGSARFFVEFFREPDVGIDLMFGWLTRGMSLSLPMIVAGLVITIWRLKVRHAN